MKILLISTSDKGGAGLACKALYHQLILNKNEVEILTLGNYKISDAEEDSIVHKKPSKKSFLSKLLNFVFYQLIALYKLWKEPKEEETKKHQFKILKSKAIKRNSKLGLELISFPESKYDFTETSQYKNADVIHLHWVAGFLDWKTFFLKNKKPIVWTLHDENPYEAIEHYKERYLGMNDLGQPLKRRYSDEENLLVAHYSQYKKEVLKNVQNIIITAPSRWLLNSSKKSELFYNFAHLLIPNTYDTSTFYLKDQSKCRDFLEIPSGKKVFLFVSDFINNKRKGIEYLQKAIKEIPNICLIVVGSNSEKMNLHPSSDTIYFGKVEHQPCLATIYSAADYFIIPSLADNFPNTMVESLLCGTPVIGFPVGGIKETIITGKNGILTEDVSVDSLRKAMITAGNNILNFDRNEIAHDANIQFSNTETIKKYLMAYSQAASYYS